MKSTLKIKNFGPIESADLELKSVNVFIGPQASGKSTLAKLYTICNSPRLYHNFNEKRNPFFSLSKNKEDLELFKEPSFDKFKETLEDYSIGSCLNSKTEIFFDSATHRLEIKKNKISFTDKINLSKVNEYFEKKILLTVKRSLKNFQRFLIILTLSINLICFGLEQAMKKKRKIIFRRNLEIFIKILIII